MVFQVQIALVLTLWAVSQITCLCLVPTRVFCARVLVSVVDGLSWSYARIATAVVVAKKAAEMPQSTAAKDFHFSL